MNIFNQLNRFKSCLFVFTSSIAIGSLGSHLNLTKGWAPRLGFLNNFKLTFVEKQKKNKQYVIDYQSRWVKQEPIVLRYWPVADRITLGDSLWY